MGSACTRPSTHSVADLPHAILPSSSGGRGRPRTSASDKSGRRDDAAMTTTMGNAASREESLLLQQQNQHQQSSPPLRARSQSNTRRNTATHSMRLPSASFTAAMGATNGIQQQQQQHQPSSSMSFNGSTLLPSSSPPPPPTCATTILSDLLLVFPTLPARITSDFSRFFTPVYYPAGSIIFAPGEVAETLFVVREGEVEIRAEKRFWERQGGGEASKQQQQGEKVGSILHTPPRDRSASPSLSTSDSPHQSPRHGAATINNNGGAIGSPRLSHDSVLSLKHSPVTSPSTSCTGTPVNAALNSGKQRKHFFPSNTSASPVMEPLAAAVGAAVPPILNSIRVNTATTTTMTTTVGGGSNASPTTPTRCMTMNDHIASTSITAAATSPLDSTQSKSALPHPPPSSPPLPFTPLSLPPPAASSSRKRVSMSTLIASSGVGFEALDERRGRRRTATGKMKRGSVASTAAEAGGGGKKKEEEKEERMAVTIEPHDSSSPDALISSIAAPSSPSASSSSSPPPHFSSSTISIPLLPHSPRRKSTVDFGASAASSLIAAGVVVAGSIGIGSTRNSVSTRGSISGMQRRRQSLETPIAMVRNSLLMTQQHAMLPVASGGGGSGSSTAGSGGGGGGGEAMRGKRLSRMMVGEMSNSTAVSTNGNGVEMSDFTHGDRIGSMLDSSLSPFSSPASSIYPLTLPLMLKHRLSIFGQECFRSHQQLRVTWAMAMTDVTVLVIGEEEFRVFLEGYEEEVEMETQQQAGGKKDEGSETVENSPESMVRKMDEKQEKEEVKLIDTIAAVPSSSPSPSSHLAVSPPLTLQPSSSSSSTSSIPILPPIITGGGSSSPMTSIAAVVTTNAVENQSSISTTTTTTTGATTTTTMEPPPLLLPGAVDAASDQPVTEIATIPIVPSTMVVVENQLEADSQQAKQQQPSCSDILPSAAADTSTSITTTSSTIPISSPSTAITPSPSPPPPVITCPPPSLPASPATPTLTSSAIRSLIISSLGHTIDSVLEAHLDLSHAKIALLSSLFNFVHLDAGEVLMREGEFGSFIPTSERSHNGGSNGTGSGGSTRASSPSPPSAPRNPYQPSNNLYFLLSGTLSCTIRGSGGRGGGGGDVVKVHKIFDANAPIQGKEKKGDGDRKQMMQLLPLSSPTSSSSPSHHQHTSSPIFLPTPPPPKHLLLAPTSSSATALGIMSERAPTSAAADPSKRSGNNNLNITPTTTGTNGSSNGVKNVRPNMNGISSARGLRLNIPKIVASGKMTMDGSNLTSPTSAGGGGGSSSTPSTPLTPSPLSPSPLTSSPPQQQQQQQSQQQQLPPPRAAMNPGFLGELGLILDIPRTSTIIASCDCVLLELQQDRYRNFLQLVPEILTMFHRRLTTSYHIHILHLLSQSLIARSFVEYCRSEYSLENYHAWQSCQRYRRGFTHHILNQQYNRTLAQDIMERFILPTSDSQVNLSGAVVHEIMTRMRDEKIDSHLFIHAEQEALTLMNSDSFARFKQSDAFQKVLNEINAQHLIENSNVKHHHGHHHLHHSSTTVSKHTLTPQLLAQHVSLASTSNRGMSSQLQSGRQPLNSSDFEMLRSKRRSLGSSGTRDGANSSSSGLMSFSNGSAMTTAMMTTSKINSGVQSTNNSPMLSSHQLTQHQQQQQQHQQQLAFTDQQQMTTTSPGIPSTRNHSRSPARAAAASPPTISLPSRLHQHRHSQSLIDQRSMLSSAPLVSSSPPPSSSSSSSLHQPRPPQQPRPPCISSSSSFSSSGGGAAASTTLVSAAGTAVTMGHHSHPSSSLSSAGGGVATGVSSVILRQYDSNSSSSPSPSLSPIESNIKFDLPHPQQQPHHPHHPHPPPHHRGRISSIIISPPNDLPHIISADGAAAAAAAVATSSSTNVSIDLTSTLTDQLNMHPSHPHHHYHHKHSKIGDAAASSASSSSSAPRVSSPYSHTRTVTLPLLVSSSSQSSSQQPPAAAAAAALDVDIPRHRDVYTIEPMSPMTPL